MSYLDDIYGDTTTMDELAEAEFLTKVAEDAGFDLDQMSQNEIANLYVKVAQAAEDASESASEDDEKEEQAEALAQAIAAEQAKESGYFNFEKDYEEKIAEADYMGRVMAHSYAAELEKIAGPRWDKVINWAHTAPGKASDAVSRALERVGSGSRGFLRGAKAKNRSESNAVVQAVAKAKKQLYGSTGTGVGKFSPKAERDLINKLVRKADVRRGLNIIGGGAAGLGAAGAGTYALAKKSAAEENYIVGRAIEKLAERGYDVDDLLY